MDILLCELIFLFIIVTRNVNFCIIAVTGTNFWGAENQLLISIISIILFWIATWVTTQGEKGISVVTNVSSIARFSMGLIFIGFTFILIIFMNETPVKALYLQAVLVLLVVFYY